MVQEIFEHFFYHLARLGCLELIPFPLGHFRQLGCG
jgi:hypothetical protein